MVYRVRVRVQAGGSDGSQATIWGAVQMGLGRDRAWLGGPGGSMLSLKPQPQGQTGEGGGGGPRWRWGAGGREGLTALSPLPQTTLCLGRVAPAADQASSRKAPVATQGGTSSLGGTGRWPFRAHPGPREGAGLGGGGPDSASSLPRTHHLPSCRAKVQQGLEKGFLQGQHGKLEAPASRSLGGMQRVETARSPGLFLLRLSKPRFGVQ